MKGDIPPDLHVRALIEAQSADPIILMQRLRRIGINAGQGYFSTDYLSEGFAIPTSAKETARAFVHQFNYTPMGAPMPLKWTRDVLLFLYTHEPNLPPKRGGARHES